MSTAQARTGSFESVIISDLPEIFSDFASAQITLLWRGTRDGFGASEFHRRSDGHASTLSVILDTDGNIFGGFTPVAWESGEWLWKADGKLRGFLFSLKNPHGLPAKRFPLIPELSYVAIDCEADRGPSFGSNDLSVYENATGSSASFGTAYKNDTEIAGSAFFTGSANFQIKEIEVFEIAGLDPPSAGAGSARALDSLIVSELPEILSEFKSQWITVLWRGSRDGFAAKTFHRQCDFHTNTLTLILDTAGNIFGGYTPTAWQPGFFETFDHDGYSQRSDYKEDPSLKTVLFTLKNPHNLPPRKFPLKDDSAAGAIYCAKDRGPSFSELSVSDGCDGNNDSRADPFEHCYLNDTGLKDAEVFTGSRNFQVKEIEVFEITSSDPLIVGPPLKPLRSLDSVIVQEFPALLEEFRGKWFTLLWRGGRDGFRADEFHRRSDGRPNTLTLILDVKGNIFGGFTPVPWESNDVSDIDSAFQAIRPDYSGKSFLFTLKHQRGVPPTKFPLKEDSRNQAIFCGAGAGPCFGTSDLVVADGCNELVENKTSLGLTYENGTSLNDNHALLGSHYFQVKEIEVFQITD
jgi:hypothetical protein